MKTRLLLLLIGLAVAPARAALNVVATLPDFAAIAREIGGDKIKVTGIAKGTEDAHFVDARPSFIRVLNQADVLIEGGADLEIGWLPPLINGARNKRILSDAPGHLLLSASIPLIEVPTTAIDRSVGDVHPAGNPHYWLDPANGKLMAKAIAETFSKLDAANTDFYQANLQTFTNRLDKKIVEWTRVMEPYRGTKVLTYHKSYEYFAARFGLVIVGQLEPKPGIEPSPSHIAALVPQAKAAGVKLVFIEPFRPRKTPEYVARSLGAKLLILPDKVGSHEQVKDYFGLFDYNISQLTSALKSSP